MGHDCLGIEGTVAGPIKGRMGTGEVLREKDSGILCRLTPIQAKNVRSLSDISEE